MKMERCVWTNRIDDSVKRVSVPDVDLLGRKRGTRQVHVLPEHEAQLKCYVERASRLRIPFLAGIAIGFVLVVLGFLLGLLVLEYLALIWLGALMLFLPFVTRTTIDAFGVRTPVRLVRRSGLTFVAAGVAFLVFSPWS